MIEKHPSLLQEAQLSDPVVTLFRKDTGKAKAIEKVVSGPSIYYQGRGTYRHLAATVQVYSLLPAVYLRLLSVHANITNGGVGNLLSVISYLQLVH